MVAFVVLMFTMLPLGSIGLVLSGGGHKPVRVERIKPGTQAATKLALHAGCELRAVGPLRLDINCTLDAAVQMLVESTRPVLVVSTRVF
eukprot:SAG31_NODE_3413_length_4303_cov_1.471694_3_plen_89_part_00